MRVPVIGMSSVVIAKISVFADIIRPGGDGFLEVKETGTGFSAWIPKRLGSKIQVGDMLTILCIPTQDISMAIETFVCARQHKEGGVIEMLWSRSNFWTNLWFSAG